MSSPGGRRSAAPPGRCTRAGRWRWAAAAIALTGALIVIGPGTDAFRPAAAIAAMAALFMGLEVVLIKKLSGKEAPLRILYINNGIGSAVAAAAAVIVWAPPTAAQWGMMAALGLAMVTGQTFFIQAMRRADASFVMPFFYAALVFAAVYDLAVFGDLPTPAGVAGAALIVAGALILVWRERRRRG